MPNYSYADCLEKAYQINWTIDEVIANQQFGRSRRWLPTSLSGADGVAWYHDLSGFKDAGDLDPFTKRIFKFHWLEESQHAKMDHLEAVRVFGKMDDAERDAAIDDLIELVVAVDGLIQKQTDLDVRNFAKYAGRVLTDEENQTLHDSVLKAKRYTFIESGVTHPNFLALFGEVSTPAQQEKVQTALATVL